MDSVTVELDSTWLLPSKRVFSALCDGSQSLLGINNANSRECQRTALVRVGVAHSLPKYGALGSLPQPMGVIFLLTLLTIT